MSTDLAVALAVYGLEHRHRLVTKPLTDTSWLRLADDVARHRLEGVLVAAIADGAFAVTDDQASQARDVHAALMATSLQLEGEALTAAAILREAGVRPVVLKGVALAHLDHPDPAQRIFQDVDVLVVPGAVDAAVDALAAAGYRRDLPPRGDDFDARFAKDITLVAPSGAELDLHARLVTGAFGFSVDADELVDDVEAFTLGGVELLALGRERRALHAALALTVGESQVRFSRLRDLALLLRAPRLDVDLLTGLAARWRVGGLVSEAVDAVMAVGVSVPTELAAWARGHRRSRWERAARRTYRSAGGSNTLTLLGGLLGLRTLGDRSEYLRLLALPSAAYRRERRARHRPPEWRTGVAELLGRRR